MEEQLFVRIRGHVQGPYERDKVRALVRRGQLSRMHEVSLDGSVWKPASNYPDLFSTLIGAEETSPESRSSGKSLEDGVPELDSLPSSSGRWHYAENNMQKGPVSFEELKALVRSGNIDAADLVWTDGMKQWAPAHSVAGLLPFSIHAGGTDQRATGKVDREVTRTLTESRPWAKFIALVMYFIGALGVLLGACAIVLGARWNEAEIIATGGFSMLYGAVFVWGGQLLLRYCNDLGRLLRDNSMRRLDVSLRSLRRFWIFLSIILIVLIVNAVAVAIWAFSIGVSLSGLWR